MEELLGFKETAWHKIIGQFAMVQDSLDADVRQVIVTGSGWSDAEIDKIYDTYAAIDQTSYNALKYGASASPSRDYL